MRRRLWFSALLLASILVITMPTLAVEPSAAPTAETLPSVKAIKPMALVLPGTGLILNPTIRGEVPSSSASGPAPPAMPTGLLLTEDFEDGEMPPPGDWSVIDTNTNGHNWGIVDAATYPNFVHSGAYAGWVNFDSLAASDEWLLTPVIDLTGVPDASIEFWALSDTVYCSGGGGGATMILHVTDTGGSSIAQVWNMCDDENWGTFEYRKVTVDLSAYGGQQIKLAWQYVGIDGDSFGLDDITLFGSGGEPIIQLEPEYQRQVGDPCDVIQYDVTLWNFTNQQDTFDITYTGNWAVSGPASVGPVANNGSQTFQVEVTIPCGAECPECDTLEVEAKAQASSAISDTATIDTCAAKDWQNESNTGAQPTHWVASTCTDDYGPHGTCFYVGGISPSGVTGQGQMYDIAAGTWSALAQPAPTPVFGATLGYINGKLYLAGGFTTTSGDWSGTYQLQIYDLNTNSWSAGPPMPAYGPVTGAGGSNGDVVSGKLHVVGGCGTNACASNQHAEYDPGSTSWTARAALPYYPVFFGATAGGGKLYVGGDYWGESGFFAYDPGSDAWQDLANLPGGAAKKSPVMAYAPDCGGVFLYGGDKGAWADIQDSTWYWHPAANVWLSYPSTLNTATTGAGGGFANLKLWSFAGSGGAGAIDPPPHESLVYCCPPPPPTGAVEGYVTDANSSLPLENAAIALTGITDPEFEDSTWSDASGYYSFGPLLLGNYELEASAFGYYSQKEDVVTIEENITKRVDFVLDASMPELSPGAVGVSLPAGQTGTFTMTLDNDGTGELNFHISELPADSIIPSSGRRVSGAPIVDPQVYADLAASPNGTAEFIAYMAEQADLSQAFAIKDRSARGWYVFNALRATAERSQANLRAELDRAGVAYEPHYIVNAIVVKGNQGTLNSIATRPEVTFIGPNGAIPAPKPVKTKASVEGASGVEWNIQKVGADQVWSGFGVKGDGIVVANIDTGVDYDHEALVRQYRGNAGGGSFDHNYNWWDPYGYDPTEPTDFYGHGTHTMGTMLGDDGAGNQIGMAPDATWFTCQGFDKNTGFGYNAELLECADFILAPWDLNGAHPDPDLRADVVNNSWGGGQAQWWYNQAIYAWRAAGIFPSFSIGNDGPNCDTAGDPGDMANIIGVGATDSSDSNAPGSPADFSSRGPAHITGLTKPEVSAPGSNVRSSLPDDSYAAWDGTSMASPHVAGEAALIWSAQPDLRGDVQLTYRIIEQTADPLLVDQGYMCGSDTSASIPNNQYGWGRIDAYEAVNMAVNANWDVDWLVVEPVSDTVPPASSADIELDFDTDGLTPNQCYNAHLKVEFNDPYVTEMFVPVALCVDICLDLDDVTISGPDWLFVDHEGAYSVVLEPVTATVPITIGWNNGTTGTMAVYSWSTTGIYTIVVTATNCAGTKVVSDVIEVEVRPVYPVYLPLIFKEY